MSYTQQVQFNSPAVVTLRWLDFKQIIVSKNITVQYVVQVDGYCVFAFDQNIAYKSILIFTTNSPGFPFDPDYSQTQNDLDVTDFLTNYMPNGNASTIPRSADGRPNTLPTLFSANVQMTIIGAGDDPTLGNGMGTPFTQTSDDGYLTEHTVTWGHNDYLYLAGGQIIYANAVVGDYIDYWIYAPATTVTTVSGTGNVNLVGPGSVLIVPGVNTNNSVDLTQAVPVPNLTGTGFWDWSAPSTGVGKGTIVPNAIQRGAYDLYTVQLNLTHPVTKYQMNGSNAIDLVIPALIPRKVLPQWMHMVIITNSGHVGLQVTWVLTVARTKNT